MTSIHTHAVRETLDYTLTETGAWINVVGYVRLLSRTAQQQASVKPPPRTRVVDATMIWSAGAINMQTYQAAVQKYQAAAALTP